MGLLFLSKSVANHLQCQSNVTDTWPREMALCKHEHGTKYIHCLIHLRFPLRHMEETWHGVSSKFPKNHDSLFL